MKILKMNAFAILFACLLCTFCIPIQADAEETAVSMITINSLEDLQTHIDNDGAYSSQSQPKNETSPTVYKIAVQESGYIVLSGYATGNWAKINLYRNASLISNIDSISFNNKGETLVYYAEKGNYYYTVTSDAQTDITATVYIGFSPCPEIVTTAPLVLSNLNSAEELQTHIDNDGIYSSQDKLRKGNLALDYAIHKISITEPGYLVIKGYTDDSWNSYLDLYSDKNLISKLGSTSLNKTGSKFFIQYLEKGDYYYKITSGYNHPVATIYAGFIPSKNFINVKSITLSKDKASATINFTTPLNNATIKVVKKNVSYVDLKNSTVWNARNVLSCTSKLKVTANGNYTARISADGSDNMYTIKFKVSNIKNSKPTTPKVTAYKKNTKVVKGKTTAYTTVYVKIGNKTYKATADKTGQFTVKTSTLKKNTKVIIFSQNSAGTKSKTKTVTVK